MKQQSRKHNGTLSFTHKRQLPERTNGTEMKAQNNAFARTRSSPQQGQDLTGPYVKCSQNCPKTLLIYWKICQRKKGTAPGQGFQKTRRLHHVRAPPSTSKAFSRTTMLITAEPYFAFRALPLSYLYWYFCEKKVTTKERVFALLFVARSVHTFGSKCTPMHQWNGSGKRKDKKYDQTMCHKAHVADGAWKANVTTTATTKDGKRINIHGNDKIVQLYARKK